MAGNCWSTTTAQPRRVRAAMRLRSNAERGLTKPVVLHDGRMEVATSPGIGPEHTSSPPERHPRRKAQPIALAPKQCTQPDEVTVPKHPSGVNHQSGVGRAGSPPFTLTDSAGRQGTAPPLPGVHLRACVRMSAMRRHRVRPAPCGTVHRRAARRLRPTSTAGTCPR
jgi:hypothetical protein